MPSADSAHGEPLQEHARQIRDLAANGVGLADSLVGFKAHVRGGGDLTDLLSWSNHPNRIHLELVARLLLRCFQPR